MLVPHPAKILSRKKSIELLESEEKKESTVVHIKDQQGFSLVKVRKLSLFEEF